MKGFTQLENKVIVSETLSNNSKITYSIIKAYDSIPNFKTSKGLLIKKCGLSEKTLLKAIKELKDENLIVQLCEGRNYWYSIKKTKPVEKEEQPKEIIVEDYKEKGIQLPISLDEPVRDSKPVKGSQTMEEIERELISEEKWNISEIHKAIDYAKLKGGKSKQYILKCLEQKWYQPKEGKKLRFNDFENQREYDYDSLEKKLLGWEKEDEPKEIEFEGIESLFKKAI